MERLNKYLAQCGVASRRGADELILEGRVRVNGRVVTELGMKVDPTRDLVQVGQRKIRPKAPGIVLFHKPRHVVSTLADPEGRECIAHYLGRKEQGYFPVGRLDFESTGLIILTNDGELADRLLHPKYQTEREYEVRVGGIVSEKVLRRLNRGVRLEDGVVKAEAQIVRTLEDSTWLKIRLTSGRNQVIRRVMKHLRHPVSKLHRISHGPLRLGKLKRGELSHLGEEEYQRIRKKVLGQGKK